MSELHPCYQCPKKPTWRCKHGHSALEHPACYRKHLRNLMLYVEEQQQVEGHRRRKKSGQRKVVSVRPYSRGRRQ